MWFAQEYLLGLLINRDTFLRLGWESENLNHELERVCANARISDIIRDFINYKYEKFQSFDGRYIIKDVDKYFVPLKPLIKEERGIKKYLSYV